MTRPTRLPILLALLLIPAASHAAEALGINEAPSINVSGEAEIRVLPDQAVLKVIAQHCGTDLVATRLANQQVAREVLAAVRAVGGKPEEQASTPSMSFPRRYDCPGLDEKQRETGYTVTTQLSLRLDAMEQVDPLLAALSSRPEVQLQDVEYRTTELRKHRDQARALAIRAAREKAEALAAELGQSIGPAIWISAENDSGSGYWSWSQYHGGGLRNRGALMQNMVMDAGGGGDGGSELAASGKISVRATVSVRFELRP